MTPKHSCLPRVMLVGSRNYQAVRPPVASLLEISEAMRAQEVPPVDWMGGWVSGGLGGWQLMNFFFFVCVFFSLWNLCHGWQILFIFCNLCILFVFFLLLWGWEIFVLHILLGWIFHEGEMFFFCFGVVGWPFWCLWRCFEKLFSSFLFFGGGVKKVIRTFAVPLRLHQRNIPIPSGVNLQT